MKKSLALIISLIMIFSTFSVCTISANAATAAPAAVSTQEVRLENDLSLMFKGMFRGILNSLMERFGIKSGFYVTGIDINKSKITMNPGESIPLKATLEPEKVKNETINWISEDPSVAVVWSNGVVEAKEAGSTKVYAIASDGYFYDSCIINVTNKKVPCEDITVSTIDVSLTPYSNSFFTVNTEPANCYDKITVSTNDNAITARVSNGIVYVSSVSEETGTFIVYVSCGNIKEKVYVTVGTESCQGIMPNDKHAIYYVEENIHWLPCKLEPSHPKDRLIVKSSDESVVSVSLTENRNGTEVYKPRIKAVSPGESTITFICGEVTQTMTVIVTETPSALIRLFVYENNTRKDMITVPVKAFCREDLIGTNYPFYTDEPGEYITPKTIADIIEKKYNNEYVIVNYNFTYYNKYVAYPQGTMVGEIYDYEIDIEPRATSSIEYGNIGITVINPDNPIQSYKFSINAPVGTIITPEYIKETLSEEYFGPFYNIDIEDFEPKKIVSDHYGNHGGSISDMDSVSSASENQINVVCYSNFKFRIN